MTTLALISILYCCSPSVSANDFYALSRNYKDVLPEVTCVMNVTAVTLSRCTVDCIAVGCTSIFYKPLTQDCRLYNERPYDMNLQRNAGWSVYHREGQISSWATKLIAVSSEYAKDRWNGEQALGKPDVYPIYEDHKLAWASAEKSLPHEWIQLGYPETMYIKQICIYEVYHAGGVKEISARRPDKSWEILWKANYVQNIENSRIFQPELKKADFKTDVVRITVDGTVCKSWPEIDAVKLIGDYKAY